MGHLKDQLIRDYNNATNSQVRANIIRDAEKYLSETDFVAFCLECEIVCESENIS